MKKQKFKRLHLLRVFIISLIHIAFTFIIFFGLIAVPSKYLFFSNLLTVASNIFIMPIFLIGSVLPNTGYFFYIIPSIIFGIIISILWKFIVKWKKHIIIIIFILVIFVSSYNYFNYAGWIKAGYITEDNNTRITLMLQKTMIPLNEFYRKLRVKQSGLGSKVFDLPVDSGGMSNVLLYRILSKTQSHEKIPILALELSDGIFCVNLNNFKLAEMQVGRIDLSEEYYIEFAREFISNEWESEISIQKLEYLGYFCFDDDGYNFHKNE